MQEELPYKMALTNNKLKMKFYNFFNFIFISFELNFKIYL